ncbi:MAG TPA: hypothetical protein VE377_01195 [Candidatus Dormibacteraeota bacterium]|nr:hypothetical protein [Candidatus Dormibacteraeota bacterium]
MNVYHHLPGLLFMAPPLLGQARTRVPVATQFLDAATLEMQ